MSNSILFLQQWQAIKYHWVTHHHACTVDFAPSSLMTLYDLLDMSNSIWVLQTMTGYKIPLSHTPPHTVKFAPLYSWCPCISVGRQGAHKTTHAVTKLSVLPIPKYLGSTPMCSHVVSKKNREKRLIICLQKSEPVHASLSLHNERNTIVLLQNALLPQTWMMKIHLKYVYITILIHPESQELLRFWLNQDSSFSDRIAAASPMTQCSSMQ